MEIRRRLARRSTIEWFAELHDLVMLVDERPLACPAERFYARFERSAITENVYFLSHTFGNGHTEKEAIRNYATIISGRHLVVDPDRKSRREFSVPILVDPLAGDEANEE